MRSLIICAAALLVACGSTLPGPLSASERRALGVNQGIVGRTAIRAGDCMPGGVNLLLSCSVTTPNGRIAIVSSGPSFPDLFNCALAVGGGLRPRGTTYAAAGSEVASANITSDHYGLALDAGTYFVFIVDSASCGECISGEADLPDGGSECAPIAVSEGNVTEVDFIKNLATE